MGLNIFSGLFSRKKKTTMEKLEEIDKKIKEIEKNKESSLNNERKIIGKMILYSILLYALIALAYFFLPDDLLDPMIGRLVLLIFPFMLYLTRRFLKWFYFKRIKNCEKKLNALKSEKKKTIEQVKETETYKVAKEILERFSDIDISEKLLNNKQQQQQQQQQPVQMVQLRPQQHHPPHPPPYHLIQQQHQQQQQSRILANNNNNNNFSINVNRQHPQQQMPNPMQNSNLVLRKTSANTNSNSNEPVIRTIVPRPFMPTNRSRVDKILDFLVGDGPSNRYALICRRCHSHNGMALREEFEYISFNCCYCTFFNPARKMKLNSPPIEALLGSSDTASSKIVNKVDAEADNNDSGCSEDKEENAEKADNNAKIEEIETKATKEAGVEEEQVMQAEEKEDDAMIVDNDSMNTTEQRLQGEEQKDVQIVESLLVSKAEELIATSKIEQENIDLTISSIDDVVEGTLDEIVYEIENVKEHDDQVEMKSLGEEEEEKRKNE